MTSIERAQRFLKNKGRTLALAAVPLAALTHLAAPAKATPNFNFATASCLGFGAAGNTHVSASTCSETLTPTQANGANGVSAAGNFAVSAVGTSGSYGLIADWSFSNNGVPFTGTMPLTWDFTVTPSNLVETWGWSVEFNFLGPRIFVMESNVVGLTGTQEITGSDAVTFNSATLGTLQITLRINQFPDNLGDSMLVDVPAGSTLDVNGQAIAPEPASAGLVALPFGMALLAKIRRRLRKYS